MNEVNWTAADLDRCEHGRHSIDWCMFCPGGKSTGNLFLLPEDDCQCYPADKPTVRTRVVSGRTEARIGTTYYGAPIWVIVKDVPRGG